MQCWPNCNERHGKHLSVTWGKSKEGDIVTHTVKLERLKRGTYYRGKCYSSWNSRGLDTSSPRAPDLSFSPDFSHFSLLLLVKVCLMLMSVMMTLISWFSFVDFFGWWVRIVMGNSHRKTRNRDSIHPRIQLGSQLNIMLVVPFTCCSYKETCTIPIAITHLDNSWCCTPERKLIFRKLSL